MPSHKKCCTNCLEYAMNWTPGMAPISVCVPSDESDPEQCSRCDSVNEVCIAGSRKTYKAFKALRKHIVKNRDAPVRAYTRDRVCLSLPRYYFAANSLLRTTKALQNQARVALRVRYAEIAVEAAAAAERTRVRLREHLARVSSMTLATMIDLTNAVNHLVQHGTAAGTVPLPLRVGPVTMPDDCVWDGGSSEDDGDGSDME